MPSRPCSFPPETESVSAVPTMCPPDTTRTRPDCSATYIRVSPWRHASATGLFNPLATGNSASFTAARFVPGLVGSAGAGVTGAGGNVSGVVAGGKVNGAAIVVLVDAGFFLAAACLRCLTVVVVSGFDFVVELPATVVGLGRTVSLWLEPLHAARAAHVVMAITTRRTRVRLGLRRGWPAPVVGSL